MSQARPGKDVPRGPQRILRDIGEDRTENNQQEHGARSQADGRLEDPERGIERRMTPRAEELAHCRGRPSLLSHAPLPRYEYRIRGSISP